MTKAQTLISKLTILAMIVSLFAFIQPARAASLSSLSDVMTNQTAGETSSHKITFTLDSGTTFAANDTITVDFHEDDSGFTVDGANTTATDFDITVAGTEETIVSSCAGDEISFSVNDTTGVVTFTACGSYTSEAAGSTIVIEYGTQATNGGNGTDRVTNNASAGSYTIDINAAGDTGTLAVPVQDSDQVSITASVDPSITFDIDTATTDTETSQPYSVAFGTITTSDVKTSGTTDGVNMIILEADTNASSGVNVTVKSANGANGLVSSSVSADKIPSADGTMAAGTANYGICVTSTGLSGFTKQAPFDGATCDIDGNANVVGGLTTSAQSIVSTTGPVSAAHARVIASAAISGTTPAHNDYADTLTFIATGTF